MIKSLINLIFNSEVKKAQLNKELKKNPSFRTIDEIDHSSNSNINPKSILLKEDEVRIVTMPDFGNLKGFHVSEWTKKNGSIIKTGDIVCVLENENITFELETLYSGKLIITAKTRQSIQTGTELFKVEGIKNLL